MTTYSDPLEQRFEAKIKDLARRLSTAEQQIANSSAGQLVAQQVLTSSQPSVTLPASGTIPQTFTNLRLIICAQSDGTGTTGYDSANLRFNGITSGYNWNSLFVTQGASAVSVFGATAAGAMQCAEIWNSHFGTPGRGISTIDIPNYSDTTCLKSFTGTTTASDGGTAGILQSYSGMLGASNTAAITSLTVLMNSGNFLADSTFSLYAS